MHLRALDLVAFLTTFVTFQLVYILQTHVSAHTTSIMYCVLQGSDLDSLPRLLRPECGFDNGDGLSSLALATTFSFLTKRETELINPWL